jgi:hypothetical protein
MLIRCDYEYWATRRDCNISSDCLEIPDDANSGHPFRASVALEQLTTQERA